MFFCCLQVTGLLRNLLNRSVTWIEPLPFFQHWVHHILKQGWALDKIRSFYYHFEAGSSNRGDCFFGVCFLSLAFYFFKFTTVSRVDPRDESTATVRYEKERIKTRFIQFRGL